MTDDDIDPAARPTRRTFSAEYKAEILAEYDPWPKGPEERGAILRREGLYSSHISERRKQAEAAAREGLARKSKKRRSREEIELDKLRAKNERLEAELERTKLALEITGKAHALRLSHESRPSRPGFALSGIIGECTTSWRPIGTSCC